MRKSKKLRLQTYQLAPVFGGVKDFLAYADVFRGHLHKVSFYSQRNF